MIFSRKSSVIDYLYRARQLNVNTLKTAASNRCPTPDYQPQECKLRLGQILLCHLL